MRTAAQLFGAFEKVESQDDGTLKVYGFASSEAVDSDGEVIKAAAMAAAMPDYLQFGAVREMHQPKAAGTAIEMRVQEDGRTWFGAHVVDSEAVKKVRAGVYKGFSIGGKITSRDTSDPKVIDGLSLTEISLVDRPANPECSFALYKADGIDDLAKSDEAPAEAPVAEQTPDAGAAPSTQDSSTEGVVGTIPPSPASPTPEAATPDGGDVPAAAAADAEPVAPSSPESPATDHSAPAADAPEAEKAASATTLAKSMSDVHFLAGILQNVAYLAQDTESEAQWEQDASEVPGRIRAWLSMGVALLQDMTAEETAELLASVTPPAPAPDAVLALADAPDDLTKAGARHSKADADRLQTAHDALVGLGAACGSAKSAGTADDLAKADTLTKALDAMTAERDALTKRVKELEAEPLPAKGAVNSFAVLGKAADSTTSTPAPVEPTDAVSLIKMVHANGGQRVAKL